MGQDTAKPVLDREDLLTRCLGNIEFAQRILSRFRERCAEDLASLEQAAQAGDADTAATLAHRIKGSAGNASALSMQAVAAAIEQAARQGTLGSVQDDLRTLRHEWDQFLSAMGHFS
ncbi:MAG: Hpt domain-containing protein [Pirellulales bacterium]|nr:Hpt domain-containing protein [Pirellulales bacterium]